MLYWKVVFFKFDTNCFEISSIPPFGITANPSPNILNTNSNILLEVFSSFSKNIPVKNGVKNWAIIWEENPNFCKYALVLISLDEKIASIDLFFSFKSNWKILNLSERVPIPEKSVEKSVEISLKGSPITCCLPFLKITAPGFNFCSLRALKSRYFWAAG